MTSPFTPPSNETGVVPPNRAPPQNTSKTLVLWLALVALFFAAHLVLREDHPLPRQATPPPTRGGEALGFLIPLATYVAMALALAGLRARLPAQYRTGELRALDPPAPEPVAPTPLRPLAVSLSGSGGASAVRLDVDDAGLHWHEPGRLLVPPRELHVAWTELQAISTARVSGPLFVWGLLVTLLSIALYGGEPTWALVGASVGVALLWLGRRTARGALSFSTATHVLTFQSRALDAELQAELMSAARARVAHAVAPSPQGGQGVLYVLFAEPFVLLSAAVLGDDALRARLLRQGLLTPASHAGPAETEASRAGLVQTRLFGIWRGVLCGLGPVSTGLGWGIATADLLSTLIAWVLSFVLGLVVLTRTTTLFARFSGMAVVRPT